MTTQKSCRCCAQSRGDLFRRLLNSFAWINHSFSKFEERHGDGDAAYEEGDPVYGGLATW
jgi:hypothetical protein